MFPGCFVGGSRHVPRTYIRPPGSRGPGEISSDFWIDCWPCMRRRPTWGRWWRIVEFGKMSDQKPGVSESELLLCLQCAVRTHNNDICLGESRGRVLQKAFIVPIYPGHNTSRGARGHGLESSICLPPFTRGVQPLFVWAINAVDAVDSRYMYVCRRIATYICMYVPEKRRNELFSLVCCLLGATFPWLCRVHTMDDGNMEH